MRIARVTGALAAAIVLAASAGCAVPSSADSSKAFVTDDTTGQKAPATLKVADHPVRTKKKTQPGFNGDGTYEVGPDIKAGKYISGGEYCYWARLKGLSGDFDDIIANGTGPGRQVVIIKKTDAAFETQGCNRWVKK